MNVRLYIYKLKRGWVHESGEGALTLAVHITDKLEVKFEALCFYALDARHTLLVPCSNLLILNQPPFAPCCAHLDCSRKNHAVQGIPVSAKKETC